MPEPYVDASSFGVDSSVISADELAARVSAMLREVPVVSQHPATPSGTAALSDIRMIAAAIAPLPLTRGPGLRGLAAWVLKRVVRKLTAWYVEPRWEAQRAWDERLLGEVERLAQRNLVLRLQVLSFFEQLAAVRAAVEDAIPAQIHDAAQEIQRAMTTREDVAALQLQIDELLRRLGAASATAPTIDYSAFEDAFRGSSTELKAAQQRYLELVEKLAPEGQVVDVGCGRGELVELLRDAGIEAVGVDPDASMVATCRAKGLAVVQDDGIRFLERMKPSSLRAVLALQVVEHLLTSEMERLVRAAFDALAPGGALVMETINPRSLHALGNHFFADASHVRPVHPETLRFICQQVGYGPVELIELSPHPAVELAGDVDGADPAGQVVRRLVESVFGYQDYAIVATRPA